MNDLWVPLFVTFSNCTKKCTCEKAFKNVLRTSYKSANLNLAFWKNNTNIFCRYFTWQRKNPKCQPPSISSSNRGTITVNASNRSVKAKDAIKRWPGLCKDRLHIMHNMMKKLPKIAIRVTRQSTAKMNHFSTLLFTFPSSSFFPSNSDDEVTDVSLVVEDASISLECPRRNEDRWGRAFGEEWVREKRKTSIAISITGTGPYYSLKFCGMQYKRSIFHDLQKLKKNIFSLFYEESYYVLLLDQISTYT